MSTLNKTLKKRKTAAPHLIIQAGAGTGKTTTLIEGLKALKGLNSPFTPSMQQKAIWDSMYLSDAANSICMVAFNKAIATELQQRVPKGVDAMTMHSLGFKAVMASYGKLKVNSYRVSDIIAELLERDIRDIRRKDKDLLQATEKLVGLCKLNLVLAGPLSYAEDEEDQLDKLASHYDVDLNGNRTRVYDLVPRVLERCKAVDRDQCIDFNDMIWLPIVLDCKLPRYDLLLVDEAQDLNRCQQELAKRVGKRLILCGDVRQAIYGFAGADSKSMDRLSMELYETKACCEELPLNETRRCGKAIVKEANKLVKDFYAHETCPEGEVKRLPLDKYQDQVEIGDMILCRVNAPLVQQCFRFLKNGRKANIQGRDVGQGLISTIKKQNAADIGHLAEKLSIWYHSETEKELRKRNSSDARLIALQDRYDCLCCFLDNATTVEKVISKIEDVFTSERQGNGILLSSIHKAKGLEADRVFLLQPEGAQMPHPMARSAWQKEQEYNLLYVAITRAIHTLVYVS